MSKQRNPEATCEKCLYWRPYADKIPKERHVGKCQKNAPRRVLDAKGFTTEDWVLKDDIEWCGDHPDFFLPEPPERAHEANKFCPGCGANVENQAPVLSYRGLIYCGGCFEERGGGFVNRFPGAGLDERVLRGQGRCYICGKAVLDGKRVVFDSDPRVTGRWSCKKCAPEGPEPEQGHGPEAENALAQFLKFLPPAAGEEVFALLERYKDQMPYVRKDKPGQELRCAICIEVITPRASMKVENGCHYHTKCFNDWVEEGRPE